MIETIGEIMAKIGIFLIICVFLFLGTLLVITAWQDSTVAGIVTAVAFVGLTLFVGGMFLTG